MTIAAYAPNNPFSAHAERSVRGRAAGARPPAAPTRGAEKAVQERDALMRHYRRASRARLDEACRVAPALADLRRALARFHSLEDADALVEAVERAAGALRGAHSDIRAAALSLASDRIQRIRLSAGLAPFDDPLPAALESDADDAPDAFRICKTALGVV